MYFQVEINLSFQIGNINRVYIHLSLLRKHLVFFNFLIFFTVGITRKNHLLKVAEHSFGSL